jgi:hypothetical protein
MLEAFAKEVIEINHFLFLFKTTFYLFSPLADGHPRTMANSTVCTWLSLV